MSSDVALPDFRLYSIVVKLTCYYCVKILTTEKKYFLLTNVLENEKNMIFLRYSGWKVVIRQSVLSNSHYVITLYIYIYIYIFILLNFQIVSDIWYILWREVHHLADGRILRLLWSNI